MNWFGKIFHRKNIEIPDESINVVESIGKAKTLYKDLIIKAHPDRNPNNVELATSITDQLNSNRFNYRELLRLKTIIETELK